MKLKQSVMKIFFIWFMTICLGVANGLLYSNSNLETPQKIVFMSLVSVVCVVFLLYHRKITRNWKAPSGKVPSSWSEIRIPVFRITMLLSFFFLILLVLKYQYYETQIVSCITILIASFIGYKRELNYTHGWL